jgi:hypothetical protein
MSCPAKDQNYDPCRFSPQDTYCKHHTYLNDYTDDMFKKMSVCTRCNMWKFIRKGTTCSECRERGEKVRQEAKEYLEQNRQDIIDEIVKIQKIEEVKLTFMEKEWDALRLNDMAGYREYLKKEKYKSIDKVMNKFI